MSASFQKQDKEDLAVNGWLVQNQLFDGLSPDYLQSEAGRLRASRFSSQILAIYGISTGDEGKGRTILDIAEQVRSLTGKDDALAMVLKTNGGPNSGHTAAGLKLNLLPAGVADPAVEWIALGQGVVADPRKIWWETKPLETDPGDLGISPKSFDRLSAQWHKRYDVQGRLCIDKRTQLLDVTHRLLDLAWERYRANQPGGEARGTTASGISPAYQDETALQQIFFEAFRGSKDAFAKQMSAKIDRALDTIKHVCGVDKKEWHAMFDALTEREKRANKESVELGVFDEKEFDFSRFKGSRAFKLNKDEIIETYWKAGSALSFNIVSVDRLVLDLLAHDRFIACEFGQSYWLDKRLGYPPNTTASHTSPPEVFLSAGIPVQPLHSIGIAKAYDTKVGTHHFPTQLPTDHPLSAVLSKLEFGVTTGRQRMVGWCDAVEKGHVLRQSGFQDLVINKLDALTYQGDWHDNLKICYAYAEEDGYLRYDVPTDTAERKKLSPVYKELPGWKEDISAATSFLDLPENAQVYVAAMYRAIINAAFNGREVPDELPNIRFIGIGPDPKQILSDVPPPHQLMKVGDVF